MTPVEYTGPERRHTERRDDGRSLADVEAAFNRALIEHEEREKEGVKNLIDELEKRAFPDGALNHCSAHQAQIDAAEDQKNFLRWLKMEIAKKSIWGILQVLVFLVVAGAAAKLGLGSVIPGIGK